ncbi:hypothetical protein HDU97_005015 [Phlyctochytrium planicorne]|nr:hypothetical protein HDU97_005015 [Phlyctochytrium planicorne]
MVRELHDDNDDDDDFDDSDDFTSMDKVDKKDKTFDRRTVSPATSEDERGDENITLPQVVVPTKEER